VIFFLKKTYLFIFGKRECREKGQRERERIPGRLPLSAKPHRGLNPTTLRL